MDIGHRLKLFRVASGLKQIELAKRLKFTQNYVYMVESGRREPSREYLVKFADEVKIPLSVIFLNSKTPSNKKSRKLVEDVLALMAEYSEAAGVRKSRT